MLRGERRDDTKLDKEQKRLQLHNEVICGLYPNPQRTIYHSDFNTNSGTEQQPSPHLHQGIPSHHQHPPPGPIQCLSSPIQPQSHMPKENFKPVKLGRAIPIPKASLWPSKQQLITKNCSACMQRSRSRCKKVLEFSR